MRNAFEILGATPVHTGEELKELLEEQQLLSDDEKELADAYAALTNPKKRIRHEIEYLAKEYFEPFNELFMDNAESEQQMSVSETCTAIIDLGDWFDNEADYIIDEINENREISGFPSIDDDSVVSAAISELRASCVSAVIKYFDYFDESGLVAIFNALVKRDDFQSFFVDELLAHYEIKIADTLQEKQDACENSFNEIERLCNSFINGGALSSLIDGKITEFKKLLVAWDKIAQPLQVNAQHRGAAHDDSAGFVHEIRNRVIDLCNRSQEILTTLLSKLSNTTDYLAVATARIELPGKVSNSIPFTNYLLKIIDILIDVFAEVEVTAEQLRKDKKEIAALKSQLSQIDSQIKQAQSTPRYTYQKSGCYIATAVYGSYDCPQVWTLRRYRDNVLRENIFGRLFIKAYYFLSPKFIKSKLFGKWMQRLAKKLLDKKVGKLNSKGFDDTPYDDI